MDKYVNKLVAQMESDGVYPVLLSYLRFRKWITTLNILPALLQAYINRETEFRNPNPGKTILSNWNSRSKRMGLPHRYPITTRDNVDGIKWIAKYVIEPKKIKVESVITKWAKECISPYSGLHYRLWWLFSPDYRRFRKIKAAYQLKLLVKSYAKLNMGDLKISAQFWRKRLLELVGEHGAPPANIDDKIITLKDCLNLGRIEREINLK